jgi:hypothetical protein
LSGLAGLPPAEVFAVFSLAILGANQGGTQAAQRDAVIDWKTIMLCCASA